MLLVWWLNRHPIQEAELKGQTGMRSAKNPLLPYSLPDGKGFQMVLSLLTLVFCVWIGTVENSNSETAAVIIKLETYVQLLVFLLVDFPFQCLWPSP